MVCSVVVCSVVWGLLSCDEGYNVLVCGFSRFHWCAVVSSGIKLYVVTCSAV